MIGIFSIRLPRFFKVALSASLLWHEYLIHRGLRRFLGDAGMDALLDDVWKEYGEFIRKSDISRKYGADLESAAGQRLAAEEYLARHAEEMSLRLTWAWDNEETGRFRQFLNRARKILAPVLPKSYLAYTSDARMARMFAYALRPLQYAPENYAGQGAGGGETRFAYTRENAVPSKEGYKVERVNENAGAEFNNLDGVVCEALPGVENWSWDEWKKYMAEHGIAGKHPVSALNGRKVEVRDNLPKRLRGHSGYQDKMSLVSVIPNMLNNAVLIQSETKTHEGSSDQPKSYILATKVRFGEADAANARRYVVGMVIHEDGNGNLYYDHELTDIKKYVGNATHQGHNLTGTSPTSVMNII